MDLWTRNYQVTALSFVAAFLSSMMALLLGDRVAAACIGAGALLMFVGLVILSLVSVIVSALKLALAMIEQLVVVPLPPEAIPEDEDDWLAH